MNRLQLLQINS